MYFSERNRLMMIFKNYEKKTLIKLIPIIVFNEIAMLVYSLFDGWLVSKIKSYVFLIRNKDKLKDKRKNIQSKREQNDEQIMKKFESKLDFEIMNNLIIKRVINPIYWVYKKIILT